MGKNISWELSSKSRYDKFVNMVAELVSEDYFKWVCSAAETKYGDDMDMSFEEHILGVISEHAEWIRPAEFMKVRALHAVPAILPQDYYDILLVKLMGQDTKIMAEMGKL